MAKVDGTWRPQGCRLIAPRAPSAPGAPCPLSPPILAPAPTSCILPLPVPVQSPGDDQHRQGGQRLDGAVAGFKLGDACAPRHKARTGDLAARRDARRRRLAARLWAPQPAGRSGWGALSCWRWRRPGAPSACATLDRSPHALRAPPCRRAAVATPKRRPTTRRAPLAAAWSAARRRGSCARHWRCTRRAGRAPAPRCAQAHRALPSM